VKFICSLNNLPTRREAQTNKQNRKQSIVYLGTRVAHTWQYENGQFKFYYEGVYADFVFCNILNFSCN